jgi:hypothetical protein
VRTKRGKSPVTNDLISLHSYLPPVRFAIRGWGAANFLSRWLKALL